MSKEAVDGKNRPMSAVYKVLMGRIYRGRSSTTIPGRRSSVDQDKGRLNGKGFYFQNNSCKMSNLALFIDT